MTDQPSSTLLALVSELLDDHAKLFNNVFLAGFKKPTVNEEYSLDLRQRVIIALKAATPTPSAEVYEAYSIYQWDAGLTAMGFEEWWMRQNEVQS